MIRPGRVTIVAAALAVLVAGGGAAIAVRVTAQPPPGVLRLDVPASYMPVPGAPPLVAKPPRGSLALQGQGVDIALLDPDVPRPIASVAKAMTAYVVLQAHPLRGDGDAGPTLTMTATDVQDWQDWVRRDGSTVPVVAGEQLSERDLLLGLMLPSANNFADTLGRWVSGSVDAFVAQLNRTAALLGMQHSHFADASGFSPQTVSTASDLVRLGRAVLGVPALAAIVQTQHAQLPDGTKLDNLDSLLGTEDGWLGIKTGETPEAGGCLLFAARRAIGGVSPVTLVGAVLGQADLAAALSAARLAADSGFSGYAVIHAEDVPPVHGEVTTRWGASTAVHVPPGGSFNVAVRIGTTVELSPAVESRVAAGAPAGHLVGVVRGRVIGMPETTLLWTVALDRDLRRPSALWMLFQN